MIQVITSLVETIRSEMELIQNVQGWGTPGTENIYSELYSVLIILPFNIL